MLNSSLTTMAEILWFSAKAPDPLMCSAIEAAVSSVRVIDDMADLLALLAQKTSECCVLDLQHLSPSDAVWRQLPAVFSVATSGIVLINVDQYSALQSISLPSSWLLLTTPLHKEVLVHNIRHLAGYRFVNEAPITLDQSVSMDGWQGLEKEQTFLMQNLDVALTAAHLNNWRVDLSTNTTYPGPLDEEFFGVIANSVEELADKIHPDDVEQFLELGRYGNTAEKKHCAAEYRVKRQDSDGWRWLSSYTKHIQQSPSDPGWILGVTWDVTSRKEVELALDVANKKLMAALNAADMIYFEWNTRTGERSAIGQQEKVLGQTPESIQHARSAVHPDDFARDEELIQQALASGKPYHNQFRVLLPDGGYKWLQSYASVMEDEQGERVKLSGICFDITERVTTLQKLQESDAQLKRAVSAAKLIPWEWRPDSGLASGIGAFEQILGIPSAVFDPEKFHELIHPEDAKHYRSAFNRTLEKHGEYHCEYRLIRPDGKVRWLLSHGTPKLDEQSNVEYMAGVAMDVTEMKATEQELKDSLNWLHLVVQAAGINTYSIDLLNRTRKGGPLDQAMYGFSPETMDELQDLIHPDDRKQGLDAIAEAILHKKAYRIRYRICRDDNTIRWHESMAMPEFNEHDQAVRISGVAFDVHDRVEQTEALHQALIRAEKATKSKSDFLASMSHEIRTPMNAVVGVSNLLLKSNLNQQQSDWVSTLINSSDQLLELINEILDFSKLDAGAMQLHLVEFDLNEAIESSVSLIASSAAAKGLHLSVNYPLEMHQTVLADITRIRQIMVNLLSNAVKFTESGGVQVNASLHELNDDEILFEFRVKDSGIGMNTETVSRLFLPFSQGDTTFTRRFGGTGLGLSICKQLCELMGGKISLNTEIAKGSEFSLRIPLKKILTNIDSVEQPSILLQGKKIALIAASEGVASSLQKQIEHFGAEAKRYASVAELTEKEIANFDVAILPQQTLSTHDEAVHRLLLQIPCIMLQLYLTAAEQPSLDRQRYKELLYYPYLPSQLLASLNRSLGAPPLSAAIFDEMRSDLLSTSLSHLRILIAEDNEINQYVLLAMLESIGCTATVVNDGLQAVNEFEKKYYDVVLMDIEMPVMDGMQASYAIRQQSKIKQPCIIALTAHVMPDSRDKFLSAGMDDYISKPVLMTELIAALAKASQRAHISA